MGKGSWSLNLRGRQEKKLASSYVLGGLGLGPQEEVAQPEEQRGARRPLLPAALFQLLLRVIRGGLVALGTFWSPCFKEKANRVGSGQGADAGKARTTAWAVCWQEEVPRGERGRPGSGGIYGRGERGEQGQGSVGPAKVSFLGSLQREKERKEGERGGPCKFPSRGLEQSEFP